MPIAVSDSRSSPADQIAHAVKILGRAEQRTVVFEAIYRGKQRIKTVAEIHRATGLSRKRVLEEARKLVKNLLVSQTKKDGDTSYEKDSFYDAQKAKILSLAKDPKKLARFPTKVTPRPVGSPHVLIRIPRQRVCAQFITIDDVESFSKVRKQHGTSAPIPMLEAKFKEGIKRILRERGHFKDWGGERNDLLTTRLRLKGKRKAAAFAFKGRGRRGKLTPAKMGKNGDQIQRLFRSPADVFLVQYWDQIDESVIEQMGEFAKAKSVGDSKEIFYGVIDGQDSIRIIKAYPDAFSH
ncbi:MAG: hypothetical protein HY619_07600 [Thaumarchaeota archaeon]|nr:hypothetical protein [Nitrososphaerota archaeon]